MKYSAQNELKDLFSQCALVRPLLAHRSTGGGGGGGVDIAIGDGKNVSVNVTALSVPFPPRKGSSPRAA